MMDWTDRHCRYFHRLLSRHARLYTEMVTAEAILHGDRERLLGFDDVEHPVALQLGGADPGKLAEAATIGEEFGYDEVNLNVGCPSDRVQDGRFGACLMGEPHTVATAVAAMHKRLTVPVTVKCRIGIDDQDSEADFSRFVEIVSDAGCTLFIVHARKAWLSGLSPKENREVPPLDHDRVYRLKRARPDLRIVINGGISSIESAQHHLQFVDGVMVGRVAYQKPYMLSAVDTTLFASDREVVTRDDVVSQIIPYIERHIASGGRLNNVTRHLLGLYHGEPGARAFRRHLSETATGPQASIERLIEAVGLVKAARIKRESQVQANTSA